MPAELEPDPAQAEIVGLLDALHLKLLEPRPKAGLIKRLTGRSKIDSQAPGGLYIWGASAAVKPGWLTSSTIRFLWRRTAGYISSVDAGDTPRPGWSQKPGDPLDLDCRTVWHGI